MLSRVRRVARWQSRTSERQFGIGTTAAAQGMAAMYSGREVLGGRYRGLSERSSSYNLLTALQGPNDL